MNYREKEYENKCHSLTTKVDSSVKFLEEERSLRKKAESLTEQRDKKVIEIESELAKMKESLDKAVEDQKGLQECLMKTKDENDRLRREKVEGMEERQQLQYKIIDLESRLRTSSKQLSDQEREYDRCVQEKYDA